MAKTRVYEFAKQHGVSSNDVRAALQELGESVRSASSTLEASVLFKLVDHFALPTTLAALVENSPASAAIEDSAAQAAEDEASSSESIPTPSRTGDSFVSSHLGSVGRAANDGSSLANVVEARASARPAELRTPAATGRQTTADPSAPRVPIMHLGHPTDVNVVLVAGRDALRTGRRHLILDLSQCEGFYPNACAPIGAIIQYLRASGLVVSFTGESPLAQKIGLRNPLEASAENLHDREILTRLWCYFDDRQASGLVTAYIDAIQRKIVCSTGVLEALEWCLFEILDNVTQHAGADTGYAMLQFHPKSKRLAVSVADTGIGVQRSLSSSRTYRPKTAFDAITLAIREGVTRNTETNQGNGLFGLVQIIQQNGGKLNIRSGRGVMTLEGDRVTGNNAQPVLDQDHHGTLVDFQLDVGRPVSLGSALDYEPNNLRLEGFEDESGVHIVTMRTHAGGMGTRGAAAELRNFLVNLLNLGAPYVSLDFTGVAVVSSSFADEVIGKLVAEYGFVNFNQYIRLYNTTPTVQALIDRSIVKRMQTAGT